MEEIIEFVINDQVVALTFPKGDVISEKLKRDEDYAKQYLLGLLNSGYLSLSEPLSTISRMDNNVEIQIYSSIVESEGVKDKEIENCGKAEWSDEDTRLLLHLYEENIVRVGPLKKYKNKKLMWEEIARNINKKFNLNRTSVQVENRFKTILKRKKAAIDNNNTSGALRQKIDFENELNKISALDDSIEPEVVGSAAGIKILKRKDTNEDDILPSTSTMPSTSSSNKKPKKESLTETLKQIHKEKEEAREKRHKEKLDLIRELFK